MNGQDTTLIVVGILAIWFLFRWAISYWREWQNTR